MADVHLMSSRRRGDENEATVGRRSEGSKAEPTAHPMPDSPTAEPTAHPMPDSPTAEPNTEPGQPRRRDRGARRPHRVDEQTVRVGAGDGYQVADLGSPAGGTRTYTCHREDP